MYVQTEKLTPEVDNPLENLNENVSDDRVSSLVLDCVWPATPGSIVLDFDQTVRSIPKQGEETTEATREKLHNAVA